MLTKLRLRDFKSYNRCDFSLGRLTVIVGTNASGKSNICDALKVLHGIGRGYSLPDIIGEKYGPGGVLEWRGIRGGIREISRHGAQSFLIEASLVLRKPHGEEGLTSFTIRIDTADRWAGPAVLGESLVTEEREIYRAERESSSQSSQAKHSVEVFFDSESLLRSQEYSSSRPILSQMALETRQDADIRDVCLAVLDELSSIRFLHLDPDAMRTASQPGQIILGDRGENLSSVLQEICSDENRREVLLSWVRALTPMDAVDFEFPVDFSGRILVHLVESNGTRVSAFSASDGTLRFLAMIAALLSPDTGHIFFFEEFDNGIHPTRLHLLLQLVQQACREQGVQVIGTTHNPALLSFLDDDARNAALLVYRDEGSPESKVRRIADLPDVAEILQTQDLGRLHASGWLEDAASFSEPDPAEAAP